ncbi:unnamed protein product [Trichogramma brassicae]|uniref:MICOS complex subunit MIC10 n=1 Tax=Trichogramma brassicae TaxID=86971 RepID=A0A6H5IJ24_9HYME|nr:unnamed protein product [Trichogramma brassicae]
MAVTTWTEEEVGRKWDRCFADAVFKLGKWPVITGAGFGLGMAYSNCENDINQTIVPQKNTETATKK